MVYIEIIYLLLYSIVCFLSVKNIHKAKVNDIYNDYVSKLEFLNSELLKIKTDVNSHFDEVKKDVSDQNKQYLSEMNKDISKRLKELSDNVKNRPII